MKLLLSIVLFFAVGSTANATPTSAETFRQTYDSLHRVLSVFSTIAKANLTSCPQLNKDFGFSYIAVSQNASSEARAVVAEAFNVQDIPGIIHVLPNGAAERAGLRTGDLILSVNDRYWSTVLSEQDEFLKTLKESRESQPVIRLVIRRENKEIPLLLTAENTCDISIELRANNKSSAYADEKKIIVESNLIQLLKSDAELAFIVAHEFAHVVLGHSKLLLEAKQNGNNIRSSIEQSADELGIRLMMRAGYDPEAAITAIQKTDYANRGPISRMLGLFGDYMTTEQRSEFLRSVAAKAGTTE